MPRHFSPVCEICANNLKIPTTYYLLYYSASSQFECRLVLERGNLLLSLDWTIRCHHVGCIPQLSPHSRVTLEVAEMSRPVPSPTLHSKSFDEKQEIQMHFQSASFTQTHFCLEIQQSIIFTAHDLKNPELLWGLEAKL